MKKTRKKMSSQSKLLDTLWKKHGGVAVVSKQLGCTMQDLVNWKNRGGVPLCWINRVAKALRAPDAVLNYKKSHILFSAPHPDWADLVAACGFTISEDTEILKLKWPRNVK